MVPFEELQELWQSQPPRLPAAFDVRGLTEELRRFGRNQTWINLIKLFLLAFVFLRMLDIFRWPPTAVFGAVLMFTGLLIYVVLDWRNQIGISRLDFSSPSMEFIRCAHRRLRHQLNPMRRLFWLIAICVGGGFNLIVSARSGRSGVGRIAEHLAASALPFIAYVIGARIREFRFRRECGAVLERLDALLRAMEEQSL